MVGKVVRIKKKNQYLKHKAAVKRAVLINLDIVSLMKRN